MLLLTWVYISTFYFLTVGSLCQNDVSDIPDLTFSMDADEEKHILYEKNEVIIQNLGICQSCFCVCACACGERFLFGMNSGTTFVVF